MPAIIPPTAPATNPPIGSATMTATTAKVLFFGRLREIAGVSEDAFDVEHAAPIEQVFAYYAKRWPQLAAFRASVVAARNREFAPWDTQVHAGDEIAFLPPVSGG